MIKTMNGILIGGNLAGIGGTTLIGAQATTIIPDIDLTASALDSRVSYAGPAHAYRNQSGGISQSSANQWPLEYSGGTVVGRHMPEKAATNLIRDNRFANIGAGLEWTSTGGGVREAAPTGSIDGGQGYRITSTYSKPGIYDGATFIVPDTTAWMIVPLGSVWAQRHVTGTFSAAAASARFYPARQDASNYLYATDAAPSGQVTLSVIRRDNGDSTDTICLPQAEAGGVVTSPIITGTTRAASTVTVQRVNGATGITLNFSDNTTQDINFSGETLSLPVSAVDWATRYLKTISYRK